ncbi:MAG TPA: nucleoside-diphosphate sugar epimerase/dehydratase, partial [Gemmatimonadaceae bacterium]|nr:nucleoside-diphosphate sugar epimerase/dehydratase [Gemmatimonadaceae bacterium]
MERLPHVLLRHRLAVILVGHLILVPLGYWVAFALRFDFRVPPRFQALFWSTLPLLIVLRFATLWEFGLHRGHWRHFGIGDAIELLKAIALGTLLFLVAVYAVTELRGVPRSIFVLEGAVALLLIGGVRFAVRCHRERRLSWRPPRGKRTLVIGAGNAAERLLRDCFHDGRGAISPVGLVDDDPAKCAWHLHGVPVVGTTRELASLVTRHRAELLVIAIPSASGQVMQRIVGCCAETRCEYKILPSLRELLEGRVRADQLRDVQIEDLLGREPVRLDLADVSRDLNGSVVLVTGGAGSIGSELARQIARLRPTRLVLLEQAESPLYFVHLEVARANPDVTVVPVIGDITDAGRLEDVFELYRPDHVFHAAAYKHVPMMEAHVTEAVRNNVIGTLQVAQCAARYGARRFVLISTDKAVNPSSVMGATKRIAERIVLGLPSLRASRTDFRAVRFGNVLGSDGSVVPLFKRQLAAGGPLTVTHPEVNRYFMTIPEAVQLVLQAAALPEAAGRICMLEMGQPVRILDLAEQLIRLSGLVPHRDVQIVFTGLRPGEKLHEELTSSIEASVDSGVEKIRVIQTDEVEGARIECVVHQLSSALARRDGAELLRQVRTLVPEYVPQPAGPAVRAAPYARADV